MAIRDASPPVKAPPGPADIEPAHHETFHRTLTGLVTAVPVIALGVAAWQSWNGLLQPTDLVVFAVLGAHGLDPLDELGHQPAGESYQHVNQFLWPIAHDS